MSAHSKAMAPVLILGVEPRITVPIARSLYRHGILVDVASLSSAEPAPRSRAVREFIRLPQFSDSSPRFIEALNTLISKRHHDMLIPVTDAALAAVSEHDEALRKLLHLACPPPPVVQRVLNKSLTLEIAEHSGIRVPGTYQAANLHELQQLAPRLQFPVVAKPFHKSKETDFKVRYFHSYDELHDAMMADDQLGSRILLQEYCPGDGVGVEILIHNGDPLAVFQHRRLKELPHTGGAAVVAIAEEPDPELVQQAVKLLRALEWEGVAMVEFRFHRPSRRLALMEVNGRYWGTLALPIKAGVDFPLYEWQLAHGDTLSVPARYAVGTVWRWSAGYIRSWHGLLASSAKKAIRRPTVLKALLPSLCDVSPGTRDALWSFSDPLPALTETIRALLGLIGSDLSAILRRARPRRNRSVNDAPPAAVAGDVKQNLQ